MARGSDHPRTGSAVLTLSTAAGLIAPLLLVSGSAPTGSSQCAVIDSIGRCLVSAVDPGRPGAGDQSRRQKQVPQARSRERSSQPKSDDATPPEPPPSPPVAAFPVGTGWSQRPIQDIEGLLTEDGAEPRNPTAEPSPEVLAQRAVRQLDLPALSIHTSAGDGAVVGVPLWLWVDEDAAFAEPLSATATAGAAQVTVEARFRRIDWSMGPRGAVVRCNGPGTPWTGQPGPSPDCGYTYGRRSLNERTSGTGRWQVVATAVWSVTWSGFSAGAPVTGEEELRIPATTTVLVGEIQVLVDGEGS